MGYRPEGWENPFDKRVLLLIASERHEEALVMIARQESYEAGADTILEAVGEWMEEMRTIHYEVVKAIDEGSFGDTEAARLQGRDGQAFSIVKRAFLAKWGD